MIPFKIIRKFISIIDPIKICPEEESDNIYRFRNMVRWADITRMRKVSWLRLNFSGTIGKIDGQYITKISEKISKEFYV